MSETWRIDKEKFLAIKEAILENKGYNWIAKNLHTGKNTISKIDSGIKLNGKDWIPIFLKSNKKSNSKNTKISSRNNAKVTPNNKNKNKIDLQPMIKMQWETMKLYLRKGDRPSQLKNIENFEKLLEMI